MEPEWVGQGGADLQIKSVLIYTIYFNYYALSFLILFYEY